MNDIKKQQLLKELFLELLPLNPTDDDLKLIITRVYGDKTIQMEATKQWLAQNPHPTEKELMIIKSMVGGADPGLDKELDNLLSQVEKMLAEEDRKVQLIEQIIITANNN